MTCMSVSTLEHSVKGMKLSWTWDELVKSPLGVGLIFGFTTILGNCQNSVLAMRQFWIRNSYSSAVDHDSWFMRDSRRAIDVRFKYSTLYLSGHLSILSTVPIKWRHSDRKCSKVVPCMTEWPNDHFWPYFCQKAYRGGILNHKVQGYFSRDLEPK